MNSWVQKTLLFGCVLGAFALDAHAQFFPHNDTTVAFVATTNGFGRIQTYDGTSDKFVNGNDKMIDRLYQLVGYNAYQVSDSAYVWNTNDDPDVNLVDTVYYAGADSAEYFRELVMDNSYRTSKPFDINVTTLVRMWKDENYALARFGVKNVDQNAKNFKLSVMLRTKLQNQFGGETYEYDSSTGRIYSFNSSGAVGLQAVTGELKGVQFLDFKDYDATRADRDNAREWARWEAMEKESFPTENLVSSDSGAYTYVNFGNTPSLATNESYSVWVAFTQGADLDEVDERLDAAIAKYAVITSNDEFSSRTLPSKIELGQNFPNPFNPTTSISFSLPSAQQVQVEVFNTLGQKVATLVNGMRSAGSHTISFDASHLTSGMYLYRIQANGVNLVRKMTLIK